MKILQYSLEYTDDFEWRLQNILEQLFGKPFANGYFCQE